MRPILNGQVNFPVMLAPMVGLSHVALRELVRDYLPQGAQTIWPTEMLNSRRIPNEVLGRTAETLRSDRDSNLVPQILGNETEPIQKSILKLADWGAVAIDINMGCPVEKALKHNYGVALMGDPEYAAEVVRMATSCDRLPVSVKLRGAEELQVPQLLRFVEGLAEAGAAWLTLHPRTPSQKRRGKADWSQIRRVREAVQIPVIGNGDIQTVADIADMMEQTGADGVMIGRALTARPWILWQIGELWGLPPPPGREGESAPRGEMEAIECSRAVKRYANLCQHHFAPFSESLGLRKFMFYIKTMSPWLLFGHELYSMCSAARSFDDVLTTLDRFFSHDTPMMETTEFRI